MTARQLAGLPFLAFVPAALAGVLLRPLLPIDETRYLSVAWEMHLGGDFLVPHKNGAIYTDKPRPAVGARTGAGRGSHRRV